MSLLFFISENSDENYVEIDREKVFDIREDDHYNGSDIITDGSHLYNGKLKPNVKYKSGEYDYIYATDELGRICGCRTEELHYTKRKERLKHNSNALGKENGDHAGHLIGDRFGGSSNLDNLVSQSAFVNLSEYKKIENIWASALKNGQKVSVDIEVKYDGDNMRPSEFIVRYTIDGVRTIRYINN